MGRNAFPPIGDLPYFLTLPAHGFFWLLLSDSAPPPSWHVERLPATELPVLVLTEGLATLLPDSAQAGEREQLVRRTLQQLEQEVLPEFLRPRSWFARHMRRARVARSSAPRALWRNEQQDVPAAASSTRDSAARRQRLLPAADARVGGRPMSGALRTAEWTLAKVREHARAGVLIDAFADPVVLPRHRALHRRECDACRSPAASCASSARRAAVARRPSDAAARRITSAPEPTNTSVILDDALFLKAYRRAEAGPNPDVEMTRFLTRSGLSIDRSTRRHA